MMQLGQSGGKYALSLGLGLLALTACASEESPGSPAVDPDCADFAPSEPISLDANVRVVATGQNPIWSEMPLAPALIADDSGVYWYDTDGFVFARHRGEAEVVQLLQGVEVEHIEGVEIENTTPIRRVVSMATDTDRVFVTDRYLAQGWGLDALQQLQPRSRLLSIPKQGGPANVLLELEDRSIWALATDGSRLIVMVIADERDPETGLDDVSYYQVDPAAPRLEPLPLQAPYFSSRVSGDAVYWTENRTLLRSGFDDAAPQQVTRLHNDDFSVGPGYFLSQDLLLVTTRFFVQAEGSSCARLLPRLHSFASYGTALDPQYVYYYASPVYGLPGPTTTDYGTLSGELVRADVTTGELARLNTPGITLKPNVAVLGHDSESLYIENGDTLLAIQKP
jgi:hypothetical protein